MKTSNTVIRKRDLGELSLDVQQQLEHLSQEMTKLSSVSTGMPAKEGGASAGLLQPTETSNSSPTESAAVVSTTSMGTNVMSKPITLLGIRSQEEVFCEESDGTTTMPTISTPSPSMTNASSREFAPHHRFVWSIGPSPSNRSRSSRATGSSVVGSYSSSVCKSSDRFSLPSLSNKNRDKSETNSLAAVKPRVSDHLHREISGSSILRQSTSSENNDLRSSSEKNSLSLIHFMTNKLRQPFMYSSAKMAKKADNCIDYILEEAADGNNVSSTTECLGSCLMHPPPFFNRPEEGNSFDEQSFNQYARCSCKYQVLEGLGRGGYSTVVKVVKYSTQTPLEDGLKSRHVNVCDQGCGNEYAMKVIPKVFSDLESKRTKHQNQIKNELRIMSKVAVSCPFLATCHGVFESYSSVFLVMDLYTGGDLFYHLKARINLQAAKEDSLLIKDVDKPRKELNEENEMDLFAGCFTIPEIQFMLVELYLALEHLHMHGYIHRDIKIENIMFTQDGHLKLVDYGLALEIVGDGINQTMSASGSLIYMAPELFFEKKGGRHTDWWAYGILAYELLTGSTPWSSLTDAKLIKSELKSTTVALPQGYPEPAASLIQALLCREVENRVGTVRDDEIKTIDFFQELDWDAMLQLKVQSPLSKDTKESTMMSMSNKSRVELNQQKANSLRIYQQIVNTDIEFQDNLWKGNVDVPKHLDSDDEDDADNFAYYDEDDSFGWNLGLPEASQFL